MKLSGYTLIVAAALAGGANYANANANGCCAEETADLLAGQNLPVGTVTACRFSDDSIQIYYSLDDDKPGICIDEVHAEVFQLGTDHYYSIVNKVGNPKIGSFIVNEEFSSCIREYTAVIAASDVEARLDDDGDFYVAAHAVVSTGNFGAYGFGRVTRAKGEPDEGIYALDFVAQTATRLLALPQALYDPSFPNGLGFDETTGDLYYVADYKAGLKAKLYKYNVFAGGEPVLVTDQIVGRVPDATFDPIRGKYVFIAEGTTAGTLNPLYFVDPSDGTIELVCNIQTTGLSFNGDIVWRAPGTVYLATRGRDWGVLDFTQEPEANICGTYTQKTGVLTPAGSIQLAVDKNGDLVGNDANDNNQWYRVDGDVDLDDPFDPPELFAFDGPGLGLGFTDLASGTTFDRTETAWADGVEFNAGKSWATYFEVTNECSSPEITALAQADVDKNSLRRRKKGKKPGRKRAQKRKNGGKKKKARKNQNKNI